MLIGRYAPETTRGCNFASSACNTTEYRIEAAKIAQERAEREAARDREESSRDAADRADKKWWGAGNSESPEHKPPPTRRPNPPKADGPSPGGGDKRSKQSPGGTATPKPAPTEVVGLDKPHNPKTPGHWEAIVKKVEELVESGKYSKIYVNRGLSNEVPGAKPNNRPDIMAVRRDGKIDQFEVPGKNDTAAGLDKRMQDNKAQMGPRGGDTDVVPREQ